MNPFDLRGPEFLEFYVALAAVVLIVVMILRQFLGPGGRPFRRLTDPYAIALMRGGPEEAIRVATAGLVKRGLVACKGRGLEAAAGAAEPAQDPVDRAIVAACRTSLDG